MMRSLTFAAVLLLAPGLALAQSSHATHAGHAAPSTQVANTQGVVTVPADGAMTHGSPERFSITFPHEMKLKTVSLVAENADLIVVTATDAPAAKQASVSLPRLGPATYRVTWVAEAPNGQSMTGTVNFMVH